MTTFTLTIEMDNDAFEDANNEEIARILGNLTRAYKLPQPLSPGDTGTLRDSNGNTVGKWEITDESADPNACSGGVCTTIDDLCSRHSAEYQREYGRAANE